MYPPLELDLEFLVRFAGDYGERFGLDAVFGSAGYRDFEFAGRQGDGSSSTALPPL